MKFLEIDNPYICENARIQHAEDVVFWERSAGAKRVIAALKNLAGEGHKDVTVKWDGSPAIIFGRDENGNFVLTDKSGFTAKGYDGRAKSPEHLQQMLQARPGYKKNPKGYGSFVANMTNIFSDFEQTVSPEHRGYFKGDLLYFNTPELVNGNYVFKPNVVEYSVDADSELGQRIGASKTGVVVHNEIDLDGASKPLENADVFMGNNVLVVPPVTMSKPVKGGNAALDKLEQIINRAGPTIDSLLDPNTLRQLQISDFASILYTYTNSKVDSGLEVLGQDFTAWVEQSKLSNRKKENVLNYVEQNRNAFKALWQIVSGIMRVKDKIISGFDKQGGLVKQNIGSEAGGEGYVLAHPEGDLKLVPREFFSRANRQAQR